MTKIKLIRAISGHAKDATITVTPKTADYLIATGVAEAIKPGPKPATKKSD